MQQAYIGIPASRSAKVVVTVTLAGMPIQDKGTGSLMRLGRYFITFGYRVDQDTTDAELTLAALVDAFVAAWKVNRTLKDGTGTATCQSCTLDFHLADKPEYQMDAAQENRVYPIVAECRQYDTFSPVQ
jgi:hypothetical protein